MFFVKNSNFDFYFRHMLEILENKQENKGEISIFKTHVQKRFFSFDAIKMIFQLFINLHHENEKIFPNLVNFANRMLEVCISFVKIC
jgi:hypothetical protein